MIDPKSRLYTIAVLIINIASSLFILWTGLDSGSAAVAIIDSILLLIMLGITLNMFRHYRKLCRMRADFNNRHFPKGFWN